MGEIVQMKEKNLLNAIKNLWNKISKERKRESLILASFIMIGAILEVGSIAAFAPFISILIFNNDEFFRLPLLDYKLNKIQITTAFITLTSLSGLMRFLILKKGTNFAFSIGADFSREIFKRVMYQPLRFHTSINSSSIMGVSAKVNTVIYGVVLPLINLTSSIVIVFAISAALFLLDPIIFIFSSISLAFGYSVLIILVKKRLKFNGEILSKEQTEIIKIQQEALGSVRDIILDNSQKFFINRYQKSDIPFRRALGSNIFISQFPRYLLETIALVTVATLSYFLSESNRMILPLLGAIALGAQRLLPALQQIYSAWTIILGNAASLEDVIKHLNLILPSIDNTKKEINFTNELILSNVSYDYSSECKVFKNINFKIKKGEIIGVIGTTGSGKSTLIDLIMGLVPPSNGCILVDGIDLKDQNILPSWHEKISHVPQSIYIADSTVIENIAIGHELNNIDIERASWAAEVAEANEFIEKLVGGYYSMMGERGEKLSGGQRQRIGIARALYKKTSLLILDEATNALDENTEKKVIKNISKLGLTTIIIAHRKEILGICDRVIEVKESNIAEFIKEK